MKKYISLVILTTLFAVGCAKTVDSSSRSIVRRAGTTNTVNDNTAQSIGLNIVWQKTDVAETNGDATSVVHTFSINGETRTITHPISINVPHCSQRSALAYDAEVSTNNTNGIYTAVGYTGCIDGTNYYLGTTFMAFNSNQLVQEFVLMNLTTKGEAIIVQKQISSQSNATYLPDWVAYLFNEE